MSVQGQSHLKTKVAAIHSVPHYPTHELYILMIYIVQQALIV